MNKHCIILTWILSAFFALVLGFSLPKIINKVASKNIIKTQNDSTGVFINDSIHENTIQSDTPTGIEDKKNRPITDTEDKDNKVLLNRSDSKIIESLSNLKLEHLKENIQKSEEQRKEDLRRFENHINHMETLIFTIITISFSLIAIAITILVVSKTKSNQQV